MTDSKREYLLPGMDDFIKMLEKVSLKTLQHLVDTLKAKNSISQDEDDNIAFFLGLSKDKEAKANKPSKSIIPKNILQILKKAIELNTDLAKVIRKQKFDKLSEIEKKIVEDKDKFKALIKIKAAIKSAEQKEEEVVHFDAGRKLEVGSEDIFSALEENLDKDKILLQSMAKKCEMLREFSTLYTQLFSHVTASAVKDSEFFNRAAFSFSNFTTACITKRRSKQSEEEIIKEKKDEKELIIAKEAECLAYKQDLEAEIIKKFKKQRLFDDYKKQGKPEYNILEVIRDGQQKNTPAYQYIKKHPRLSKAINKYLIINEGYNILIANKKLDPAEKHYRYLELLNKPKNKKIIRECRDTGFITTVKIFGELITLGLTRVFRRHGFFRTKGDDFLDFALTDRPITPRIQFSPNNRKK